MDVEKIFHGFRGIDSNGFDISTYVCYEILNVINTYVISLNSNSFPCLRSLKFTGSSESHGNCYNKAPD